MRYYRRHGLSDAGDPQLTQIHAIGSAPRFEGEDDDDDVDRWPAVSASIRYSAGSASSPHVFDSLFADHSLRGAVPTVAALVLSEPRHHFDAARRSVAPSSSLSRYSSPLVLQAQRMGLVVPNQSNPHASVTNGIGAMGRRKFTNSLPFHDVDDMELQSAGEMDHNPGWSPWQSIPHSEVGQARTLVRQVMSSRSQQRSSRLSDEQLGRVLHEGNIFG